MWQHFYYRPATTPAPAEPCGPNTASPPPASAWANGSTTTGHDSLHPGQRRLLADIGLTHETARAARPRRKHMATHFQRVLASARTYTDTHGTLATATTDTVQDGLKLGHWLSNQRSKDGAYQLRHSGRGRLRQGAGVESRLGVERGLAGAEDAPSGAHAGAASAVGSGSRSAARCAAVPGRPAGSVAVEVGRGPVPRGRRGVLTGPSWQPRTPHRSLSREGAQGQSAHRRSAAAALSSCQYSTRKSARRRSSDSASASPGSLTRWGRLPSRS